MTDSNDPVSLLKFEPPGKADPKSWAAAEKQCLKFPEKLVQKCGELNEALQGIERVSDEHDQLFKFVVRNLISVVDNCEAALAELTDSSVTSNDLSSASTELPDKQTEEELTVDIDGDQSICLSENEAEQAADSSENSAETTDETPRDETSQDETLQDDVDGDMEEDVDEENVEDEVDDDDEQPQPTDEALDPRPISKEEAIASAGLASVNRSMLHMLEKFGVVRVDLIGRTYNDVVFDGHPIEDPFEIVESTQQGKATELTVREVLRDLWVLNRDGYIRVLSKGQVNC